MPPYGSDQPAPPADPGSPYGAAPYAGAPYGGAPYGAPRPAGKGLAITALVLGIVGFLGSLFPYGVLFAGLLLIAAIVIGIIVLVKKNPGKGMAIAALILGAVGLVAGTIISIAFTSWVIGNVEQYGTDNPDFIQQVCEDAGLTPEECDEYYG